MKILLVNPPNRHPLRSILPAAVEAERGVFPPLGLLSLAAAVRGLPGVQVEVIDAPAERLSAEDVAGRVNEGGHDLLGVTVLTFTLLDALATAAAVKVCRPETTVIAGGPHPHLFPRETLALGPFDLVLRGEGERSFRELVAGWPETLQHPPPGVHSRDGRRGEPEIAPFIEDLDALPLPARDLTRLSLYHSVLSGKRPITTIMSSRGCPYQCVFCDRPHLGKRFRPRSARNVVAEMENCRAAGIREAVFYDDTFTVQPGRVREIAELILERRLRLAWDIRARVNDLEPEDYPLLKKAGLARIHFGVESGDPQILRSLRKGISLDQARRAFRAARSADLETLAYFMVGLPGETPATLQRTLEAARELAPDYVHFSVFIPFPGTPIYEQALSRGVLDRDVWADFARDPRPDFSPPLWEEKLDEGEIFSALARLYRAFYFQPSVIWRRLRRTANLAGLIQGARMGFRILSLKGGRDE